MKKQGLRERKKEEKLRAIKDAAVELFLSKGYDDTTTREIAHKAGVGLGTVFVYADTKRDLLFLIVNDDLEECIRKASAGIRPESSVFANLLFVLRMHYEYFLMRPTLSRPALREMYFYQSGKQADRFNRTRTDLNNLIRDVIADAMEKKLIYSPETPECVAQAIFAVYQVQLRRWLSVEEPDLNEGINALGRQIRIIMCGLAPRPEALL